MFILNNQISRDSTSRVLETQVFPQKMSWLEIGIKNKEWFFVEFKRVRKQTTDKSGFHF